MKRALAFALLLVVSATLSTASWDVFLSTTMKNTAKLHGQGNVLLHYDQILRRSVDGGATWTTVEGVTQSIGAIANVGPSMVAAVLDGQSKAMNFLTSTNAGESWSQTGTLTVANNGFILELAFDGTALYAVSNRAEVFLSLDQGVTWTPYVYATGGSAVAVDGTIHSSGMWVLSLSGLYRSTDGGTTWSLQGATEALPLAPQQIEVVNGDLFLVAFGGVFRWNTDTQKWEDMSATLPGEGSFKLAIRDIRGDGSTIYATGQLLDGTNLVVSSSDRGVTWSIYGEPLPNASGVTRRAMAITDMYLVVFHNGVGASAAANGYHRMARPTTSVDDVATSSQATVYPQPASDIVTIHAPDANGPTEWTLYDVEGRVMRTAISDGTDAHLSVAGLPGGVYTVMASGNVKVRRVRVVVY